MDATMDTMQGVSEPRERANVAAPNAPRRWDSRLLLLGQKEVVIQHGDQQYRLRHTQNDKLILTK